MKKRGLKKLSLILAGLMVVSCLGACGGAADDTPGSDKGSTPVQDSSVVVEDSSVVVESEPVEEEGLTTILKDENGNTIDLGGMEVVIRSWYGKDLEEPKNAYEEARLEYLEWIQETYNFTIRETTIGNWDTVPADFSEYANSGDDGNNYIFVVRMDSAIVSAIQNGLVHDLGQFDCLDFTEEKWNKTTIDLFQYGGSTYAMFAGDNEPRTGVYFNKRLLSEAGIEPQTLYDLQEKGEWTFEKCKEIMAQVQRDVDSDGIIDIYGCVNNNANVYKAAIFANGGKMIGKDENGKFTYHLEDDNTLEGLNWAQDILTTYAVTAPDGAAWDWYKAVFKNGDAVFCFDDAYMAGGDWSNMEDDFGFLCFPKGPQATDYTNVYSNNLVVIPSCYDADKAWKLAFAYNLYTDPIPGYEDYEGWKSGYLSQFRDLESVELTLARMVENGVADIASVVPNLDTGGEFLWNLGWWTTPAAEAEKTRTVWMSHIEEANK